MPIRRCSINTWNIHLIIVLIYFHTFPFAAKLNSIWSMSCAAYSTTKLLKQYTSLLLSLKNLSKIELENEKTEESWKKAHIARTLSMLAYIKCEKHLTKNRFSTKIDELYIYLIYDLSASALGFLSSFRIKSGTQQQQCEMRHKMHEYRQTSILFEQCRKHFILLPDVDREQRQKEFIRQHWKWNVKLFARRICFCIRENAAFGRKCPALCAFYWWNSVTFFIIKLKQDNN